MSFLSRIVQSSQPAPSGWTSAREGVVHPGDQFALCLPPSQTAPVRLCTYGVRGPVLSRWCGITYIQSNQIQTTNFWGGGGQNAVVQV